MKTYFVAVRTVVRAETEQIARNGVKAVAQGAAELEDWWVDDVEEDERGDE